MSLRLLTITLILALSILIPILSLDRAESQAPEILDNEPIQHRDLAISYVVGRDGSITALIGLESFTIRILELENHFWNSVNRIDANENITLIQYLNTNGDNALLILNLTNNFLEFDLQGRLTQANLLTFQFPNSVERLGDNRTGLRLANGNSFYFDWENIELAREYSEGAKTLRVDIRSSPNFKLDPRIAITNPDFETGDSTGWTIACGSDSTQIVNSTNPINGSWSHWIRNGDGPDDNCSLHQSHADTTDNQYSQFQFRILNSNSFSDSDSTNIVFMGDGGSLRLRVFVIQNDTLGGLQFGVSYNTDSGSVTIFNHTFAEVESNTIYCVETFYNRDSSPNSGDMSMWINRTQFQSASGFDNNGLGRIDRLLSGQPGDAGAGHLEYQVDDHYLDDASRVNTCPEGFAPPIPPIIPLELQSIAPVGSTIFLAFVLIGLFALGQSNPWFVIGGWLTMFIATGMILAGLPVIALDSADSPITFTQVFPQEFNTWLIRFFLVMHFVYPLRIISLVWERLIKVGKRIKERLNS